MRMIDGDALEERFADRNNGCAGECECCEHYIFEKWRKGWCGLIADAPTVSGWVSADKRPPKQGRYLVWGLTRITPDHYDEANGFWEIQPAFWFEKSGWDRKVKFWQMLPEPPEEVSGDAADRCGKTGG